jgi:hypothetical protein
VIKIVRAAPATTTKAPQNHLPRLAAMTVLSFRHDLPPLDPDELGLKTARPATWRRVEYPIDDAARAIERAGLPRVLAERLYTGQ